MRKRVISLVLVLVLAFAFANTAAAAKTEVSVLIDRTPVKFTASDGIPFIDENSRTLVPLRIVMETYGCMVQWDQNTRTAYVVKDGVTVTVTIGQKYIRVNGMSQAIDTCEGGVGRCQPRRSRDFCGSADERQGRQRW